MNESIISEKTKQVLLDYDRKFFLQDLEAFSLSIKKKDFTNGNIFANRIMSNAYLFNKKDFGIMGFFLKEIANSGIMMRRLNSIEGEDEISEKSKSFIASIKSSVESGDYEFAKIWSDFNNYVIKTRNLLLLEDEKSAYKDADYNFTKSAYKKIIDDFQKHEDTLYRSSNNLIKGIHNELGRIGKTHGTTPNEQCLFCVITMLDRVDEYVGTTSLSEKDFEDRIKEHIIPLTEEFFKIEATSSDYVNNFDDFIWNLIKLWRSFYIQYMEAAKTTVKVKPPQSNVQEPIKSKLVDEIAKGLEEEVGIK